MIVLEKVMTRDLPLIGVESWQRCFGGTVSKQFGIQWPDPVFIYRAGAVESWRPTKLFFGRLPTAIARWARLSGHSRKLLRAFAAYYRSAGDMKKLKRRRIISNRQALAEVTQAGELFVAGAAGLIPAFWCLEWNTQATDRGRAALFSRTILDRAGRLRSGDMLLDDYVDVIYRRLDWLASRHRWPRLLMKFLLAAELTATGHDRHHPDWVAIGERARGYCYFAGRLNVGSNRGRVLRRAGYILHSARPTSTSSIRGMSACDGVVDGRVVKVFQREELYRVKRGDILVAPMTTPWYIPAMRRAAAFVTDEGGLMSHAAIIAREFKKPCIVGTKVATQVLKDGDRVTVDATHGIVRKLAG